MTSSIEENEIRNLARETLEELRAARQNVKATSALDAIRRAEGNIEILSQEAIKLRAAVPPTAIERDREAGAGILLALAELAIAKQAKVVDVRDDGARVSFQVTLTKDGAAYLPQILDEHRNDDVAHISAQAATTRFAHAERLVTKWTERLEEMAATMSGLRGSSTFQSIEHNRKRLIQTVYAAIVIAEPFKPSPSVQALKAALDGILLYFGVPTSPTKEIRDQILHDHPEYGTTSGPVSIEAAWGSIARTVRDRLDTNPRRPKLTRDLADGVATEIRARMKVVGFEIETEIENVEGRFLIQCIYHDRPINPRFVLSR